MVNLLEIFDGDMPVIFYLEDTKQKLAAPRRLYTSGHPLFFEELQRIVGEKNIATNDMHRNDSNRVHVCQKQHQDVRL